MPVHWRSFKIFNLRAVLKWALICYVALLSAFLVYIVVNDIMDWPYALYVEACAYELREPRNVPKPTILFLQVPML
jgi:hypothetical protein